MEYNEILSPLRVPIGRATVTYRWNKHELFFDFLHQGVSSPVGIGFEHSPISSFPQSTPKESLNPLYKNSR